MPAYRYWNVVVSLPVPRSYYAPEEGGVAHYEFRDQGPAFDDPAIAELLAAALRIANPTAKARVVELVAAGYAELEPSGEI